MRTIEVKLYSFDELSEEAKEKAIITESEEVPIKQIEDEKKEEEGEEGELDEQKEEKQDEQQTAEYLSNMDISSLL